MRAGAERKKNSYAHVVLHITDKLEKQSMLNILMCPSRNITVIYSKIMHSGCKYH